MSEVATIQPPSLLAKMAARFFVEPNKMLSTLKSTAFKGDVSNEQMMALLIVADQYNLNPWTKEIYAFPDKNNGIVPVVGVDGWARIINSHDQFDGMKFSQTDTECTCTIYRKDRSHPIEVTEYMSECKRNIGPWQSHPKRMLRHKAMIQCSRLAFGFVGMFDPDEAERIVERDVTPHHFEEPATSRVEEVKNKLRARKGETIDQDSGEVTAAAEPATATAAVPAGAVEMTVIDAIAKLSSFSEIDSMALWSDAEVPAPIRADDRFTKAFKHQMDFIKGKK